MTCSRDCACAASRASSSSMTAAASAAAPISSATAGPPSRWRGGAYLLPDTRVSDGAEIAEIACAACRSRSFSPKTRTRTSSRTGRRPTTSSGRSSRRPRKLGGVANMQIAPEQGTFLTMLTRLIGAEHAVEVGTFTGYSSLCIARGLPADGHLLCCDVSEEWTAIARKYWAEGRRRRPHRAPHRARCRDARGASRRSESIDFAFIDADKPNYRELLRGAAPTHAPERRHRRRQRAVGRRGASTPNAERRQHAGDQGLQRLRRAPTTASTSSCSRSPTASRSPASADLAGSQGQATGRRLHVHRAAAR